MRGILLVGAGVAALAAGFFWLRDRKGSGQSGSSIPSLRRRLRQLTHDPEVAERLVQAERDRHPDLPEARILRRVIQRLESDRR